MNASIDRSQLPWSHRFPPAARLFISAMAGVGAAFIGSFAHRVGASRNLPYGLLLALLIIGLSTWCARSRSGLAGLSVHLIVSSLVVWMLSMSGGSGDALIPAGFTGSVPVPFWSQHAGYFWFFGLIVVQLALAALPSRFFQIRLPSAARSEATQADEQFHTER